MKNPIRFITVQKAAQESGLDEDTILELGQSAFIISYKDGRWYIDKNSFNDYISKGILHISPKEKELSDKLDAYQQKLKEICILYRNTLSENRYLQQTLKINVPMPEHIPAGLISLLYKDLESDLQLDKRVVYVLKGMHIYTFEDLLRYLKKHDLDELLKERNMGILSLNKLKSFLRKYHCSDFKRSIFYDYIK